MASCPNCGFDLDVEGRCAVCGSEPSGAEEFETVGALTASSHQGVSTAPAEIGERSSARRSQKNGVGGQRSSALLVTVTTLALMALIGVGYFVLRSGRTSSSATGHLPQTRFASSRAAASSTVSGGVGAASASAGGVSSSSPAGENGGSVAVGSTTGVRSATRGGAAKISRVGFAAPVGASPVSIRATHPLDLYNPAQQPLFDITKRTELPPLSSEHTYVKWMLEHTHQQEGFLRERWVRAMKAVDRHLLVHRRVLTAFLLTPREWFVRSYNLSKTYENTALPIGYGQTISGPDLVAHMTDALDPQPNQRVLEIGTGSGYQSAVLSQLSNYVYTIEIVKPLAEQTNSIYLEHTKAMPEYANIHRRLADGYYGWPAYAPFDRIIVTTGIDHIPPDLLKELKPGGIMVIPIGPPTGQTILKITKTVDKAGRIHLKRQNLYPGITDIFVPFTASGGGTHDISSSAK